MLFTTRSVYGIKALVRLALYFENRIPVSAGYISGIEGIPSVYLEQIFSRLKQKGLILSVRGPKGGYLLARAPEDIDVLEVAQALEGAGSASLVLLRPDTCSKTQSPVEKVCEKMWKEMSDMMGAMMSRYNLGELICHLREFEVQPARSEKEYEKSLS